MVLFRLAQAMHAQQAAAQQHLQVRGSSSSFALLADLMFGSPFRCSLPSDSCMRHRVSSPAPSVRWLLRLRLLLVAVLREESK